MSRYGARDEVGPADGQEALRTKLKDLLSLNGLRHKDLANVLGLKQAALSQRMNGNQWFSESEIAAASVYLTVAVEQLMDGSIYRRQARALWVEREKVHEAERQRLDVERKTSGRAICCECGMVRPAGQWRRRAADAVYDAEGPRRGRMTALLPCDQCERSTRHAILRSDERRNAAEEKQNAPTSDDLARLERDAFVERLATFNVDVRYRTLGEPKYREKNGTPVVGIKYDESKRQWRIELNSDLWPSVQLPVLQRAWEAISSDDQEFWEGLDGPTSGAWMMAGSDEWSDAIDGLIREIHHTAPAILLHTALEISDRAESNQSEDA